MAPCSLRSFLYPHFGTASGPRNCQFWAGLDEGPAFHRQDPGGLGEFSMPRIATESVEKILGGGGRPDRVITAARKPDRPERLLRRRHQFPEQSPWDKNGRDHPRRSRGSTSCTRFERTDTRETASNASEAGSDRSFLARIPSPGEGLWPDLLKEPAPAGAPRRRRPGRHWELAPT